MKKYQPFLFLTLLLVLLLSICGTGATSQPSPKTPSSDGLDLQEIAIGGCGYPSPYQWLDNDGKLQGYDIAVAEEIAKRAGLRLRWENTEFPALFLGLDANRYQVIVGNISRTDERAEKYLYPKEYYCRLGVHIITPSGNPQGIRTVDDLAGKRVPVLPNGSTNAMFLINYNETHPKAPIDLIFVEDGGDNLMGLSTGLYDAVISNLTSVREYTKQTGAKFDIVYLPEDISEEIMPAKAYYVFTKNYPKLAEAFDTALRSMIEDGTLRSLSLKYFNEDLSR
jgi:ABC-type amino acid transport substrate-binding protein